MRSILFDITLPGSKVHRDHWGTVMRTVLRLLTATASTVACRGYVRGSGVGLNARLEVG